MCDDTLLYHQDLGGNGEVQARKGLIFSISRTHLHRVMRASLVRVTGVELGLSFHVGLTREYDHLERRVLPPAGPPLDDLRVVCLIKVNQQPDHQKR